MEEATITMSAWRRALLHRLGAGYLLAERSNLWRSRVTDEARIASDAQTRAERAEDTVKATAIALADMKRQLAATQARLDAARESEQHWRDLARRTTDALVELQRRYAPPEPIEGEVEQPKSLDVADRERVQALRAREVATP
jgi:hypothetical protein